MVLRDYSWQGLRMVGGAGYHAKLAMYKAGTLPHLISLASAVFFLVFIITTVIYQLVHNIIVLDSLTFATSVYPISHSL